MTSNTRPIRQRSPGCTMSRRMPVSRASADRSERSPSRSTSSRFPARRVAEPATTSSTSDQRSSSRMLSGQAAQLRHHPQRRPSGLHALDVVEAVAVRLRPVVPRRPGAVRRERDVRKREERVVLGRRLLHHDVEAGGSDRSRLERLIQRVLVDDGAARSEEHTSELQSPYDLVCRLLLEKKKSKTNQVTPHTVL